MLYKLTLGLFFTLNFLSLRADNLLNPYMSVEEYTLFNTQVSEAVSNHPEYLASLDSLKAAGASLKGSRSNLLPQIRLIIDSNNQLDKSFEDGANNLFEKSRSDHKTDATITVNQLLYDFGSTRSGISQSEAVFEGTKADLSSTILNLIYKSVVSYINVSAYTLFTQTIEDSYLRHKTIADRIKKKVEGGMSAPRELSRANAREAEAYAKLISVRQNLSRAIAEYRIYFPNNKLPSKLPYISKNIGSRSLDESRKIMMAGNPDILKATKSLQASLFNSKKIRSQSLPRLDLEIRGSQYNLSDQSDEYDVYSGLNLSYDIFTGGKNAALKEQAKAESDSYQNSRDSLIRNLEAEMSNALQNIKIMPSNLDAYRKAYEANKLSQYYANEQFQTSNVLLLDLLQTERDFLESSQSLLEALRSSHIENYVYLKLTGELGDEFKIKVN